MKENGKINWQEWAAKAQVVIAVITFLLLIFGALEWRLNVLEDSVNGRLTSIDERLTRMEERLTRMEDHIIQDSSRAKENQSGTMESIKQEGREYVREDSGDAELREQDALSRR